MTLWRILTAPPPGNPAQPPAPGVFTLARRMAAAVGMVLAVLLGLGWLCGCGFAHRGADGGFTVITLFKDIHVNGDVVRRDGTRIQGEVTSDVSAEAMRAVAEGAAAGAVRGAKPGP